MMAEAGVYTARGIGELNQLVCSLAEQGYYIVSVIDTQNGDYHVVAQKENKTDILATEAGGVEALKSGQYVCERCGKVAWGGDHVCRGAPSAPAPVESLVEATEIADMEPTAVGNVRNYYGGLLIKAENGQPFWCIENWDRDYWEECPAPVFAALAALIPKDGEKQ